VVATVVKVSDEQFDPTGSQPPIYPFSAHFTTSHGTGFTIDLKSIEPVLRNQRILLQVDTNDPKKSTVLAMSVPAKSVNWELLALVVLSGAILAVALRAVIRLRRRRSVRV
jgi:hypothetical protein